MRFERVIGDTVVSFGEVSLPSCEGKIASVVEIPVDRMTYQTSRCLFLHQYDINRVPVVIRATDNPV